MTQVFDSGDPELPDLPSSDMDSDYTYDDYNFTESPSSDEEETVPQTRRKKSTTTRDFWKTVKEGSRKSERGALGEQHIKKRHRKYFDSKTSASAARERVDWEPGINIETTDVFLTSLGSAITITDYSQERYRIEHLEIMNESHTAFNTIQAEQTQKHKKRLLEVLCDPPEWGKVRWINVNGLSWDAISAISQHFELHRLSIEDMVDIPQRTKVDIYPNHMFCCLPLLKLIKLEKPHKVSKGFWERPTRNADDHSHLASPSDQSLNDRISNYEMRRLTQQTMPFVQNRKTEYIELRRPLSYRKLAVGIEQVSIFITDDGTVISFFEHSANDIEKAIFNRLSQSSTILRESCDPANLLQAILDSVVDLIYPVITAYNRRLSELEMTIMLNPTISHTQELHLMIGELAMLRSEIFPTTAMVNQLKEQYSKRFKYIPEDTGERDVYFADVIDHTISYVDNIDIMRNTVENLIAFIFNILSVETNSSMQQLSMITVIFLPLSFVTGYYGMNFKGFSDLDKNVSYYWKVAVPFGIILSLVMMRSYVYKSIRKVKHRAKRTIRRKKET